jgi:phosphatidylglycerol:prolipoprotein diacylglycerol transferase
VGDGVFPTLVKLGPIEIHSYGVALAIAFIVGTQLALTEAARRGLPEGRLAALCLWILALAVVGSRLLYVASHLESYSGRILDALKLWEGGLTMYGGFVAALAGALVYLRRYRLPVAEVFDAFAPAVALGSGITRVGCFLNGCCYGKPCDLPWAIAFDEHSFAGAMFPATPLHPTQLYLSLAGFGIFAVLWSLRRRLAAHPGRLFFLFLLLESASRFAIDFLRYYDPAGESILLLGARLSITQVVTLGLIVVALAGLIAGGRRPAMATAGR